MHWAVSRRCAASSPTRPPTLPTRPHTPHPPSGHQDADDRGGAWPPALRVRHAPQEQHRQPQARRGARGDAAPHGWGYRKGKCPGGEGGAGGRGRRQAEMTRVPPPPPRRSCMPTALALAAGLAHVRLKRIRAELPADAVIRGGGRGRGRGSRCRRSGSSRRLGRRRRRRRRLGRRRSRGADRLGARRRGCRHSRLGGRHSAELAGGGHGAELAGGSSRRGGSRCLGLGDGTGLVPLRDACGGCAGFGWRAERERLGWPPLRVVFSPPPRVER